MTTTIVQAVAMTLVGVTALFVVRTRNPLHQVMVVSLYGVTLALLFLVLQAPDVALSAMTVGGVAYPALVLLTLAKMRNRER